MIPLATAIKAGAVCLALLSPDALFCHVKGHKATVICMRDGCHTPREVARSKRLLAKVYGEN